MKIYCLCPFSKSEFRDMTLQNFQQQVYPDKHLLVIENGPGIGCFSPSSNITVLRSGNHQSLAKNEGLRYLRSIGAQYWASFDCDDYYGPEYLTEIYENHEKSVVIGKIFRYVKIENGKVCLFSSEAPSGYTRKIFGGTFGCYVHKSPDFDIYSTGEETFWLLKFKKVSKFWDTGENNFMHMRWNGVHTNNFNYLQYMMKNTGWKILKEKNYPEFLENFKTHPVYRIKDQL